MSMPGVPSVAGLGSKVLAKQFGDALCQIVGYAQVLAEKIVSFYSLIFAEKYYLPGRLHFAYSVSGRQIEL
jgi:hypothetical protein